MPIQLQKIRPISPYPFEGFSLSFAIGDPAKEADPAPYSNTKEILILNTSPADTIIAAIVPVYPTFPNTLTSGTIIPPGYSVSLAIGPEGYRNALATNAFWQDQARIVLPGPVITPSGSRYNLVIYAPTITIGFDVGITYVQSPGGGGGISP